MYKRQLPDDRNARRIQCFIGVESEYPPAGRPCDTAIPRGRKIDNFEIERNDPRPVSDGDLRRRIRRAGVDDDDLIGDAVYLSLIHI